MGHTHGYNLIGEMVPSISIARVISTYPTAGAQAPPSRDRGAGPPPSLGDGPARRVPEASEPTAPARASWRRPRAPVLLPYSMIWRNISLTCSAVASRGFPG